VFVVACVVAVVSLVLNAGMFGVFFTYSNSVMPGLDRVASGASAIESMNSINKAILNPLFLTTLVGAPITAVLSGILAMVAGSTPGGVAFFAAAVVYFLGAMMPTNRVNVPLNDALGRDPVPADAAGAASAWAAYSRPWTRSNHWRGVASVLAVALTATGVLLLGLSG
jgi:uncharacterized membrane protein